jgi:hypothetical protein
MKRNAPRCLPRWAESSFPYPRGIQPLQPLHLLQVLHYSHIQASAWDLLKRMKWLKQLKRMNAQDQGEDVTNRTDHVLGRTD